MSYVDPNAIPLHEELPHGSFVSGRHVGLVYQLDQEKETNSSIMYLSNLRFETITSLIQVVLYSSNGKCCWHYS